MRRPSTLLLLVLLVAVIGGRLLPSSSSGDDPAATGGRQTAHVVRVVDGDTLLVRLDGGTEDRVRLIGIDTPETVKPGTPVQCYGKAASRAAHRLLDGRDVTLVPDAEARDRYGRLLAYVFRRPDGLFVNEDLVRRGLARPLRITPNVRYAVRFSALSAAARARGTGLWSACGR